MKKFFGNYRGLVRHSDPETGLCKIFVEGVYPLAFKNDYTKLPNAEPAMPLSKLNSPGLTRGIPPKLSLFMDPTGSQCVPDINATVWIFFESGDILKPVYFAAIPGGNTWLPEKNGIFKSDTKAVKVEIDESHLVLNEGGGTEVIGDDVDLSEINENIQQVLDDLKEQLDATSKELQINIFANLAIAKFPELGNPGADKYNELAATAAYIVNKRFPGTYLNFWGGTFTIYDRTPPEEVLSTGKEERYDPENYKDRPKHWDELESQSFSELPGEEHSHSDDEEGEEGEVDASGGKAAIAALVGAIIGPITSLFRNIAIKQSQHKTMVDKIDELSESYSNDELREMLEKLGYEEILDSLNLSETQTPNQIKNEIKSIIERKHNESTEEFEERIEEQLNSNPMLTSLMSTAPFFNCIPAMGPTGWTALMNTAMDALATALTPLLEMIPEYIKDYMGIDIKFMAGEDGKINTTIIHNGDITFINKGDITRIRAGDEITYGIGDIIMLNGGSKVEFHTKGGAINNLSIIGENTGEGAEGEHEEGDGASGGGGSGKSRTQRAIGYATDVASLVAGPNLGNKLVVQTIGSAADKGYGAVRSSWRKVTGR